MNLISFVIPCYGSEGTIEFVIEEIIGVVTQRPDFDYEIIAVNDCSPDNVLEVLLKIAEQNHKVKVLDFAKNFGRHSAVMAGFSIVQGDYVVVIDDDGQCPMDHLWELVDPIIEGKGDLTMADYPTKMQSKFKNFGSSVNSLMSQTLLNKPKGLYFSNFQVMKRYIVDEILRYDKPYPYLEGLILRTTDKIYTVEMEERERYAGRGNFTLFKSLSLWMNGFTAFSVKPLRLATVVGLVSAVIGFIIELLIVINKFINPAVPLGYSSTLAVMLFLGGIVMLMLGLIGEYIGRMYISINNSPQYVIRKKYNCEEKDG